MVVNEAQLSFIEKIKTLVTVAIFSDSYFLDLLVLKGGNAIDLVYKSSARASVDIDFSMANDFPDEPTYFCSKLGKALNKIFNQNGYQVFDVKMEEKPKNISPDISEFWGGYDVRFKIIDTKKYEIFSTDIEKLRRNALMIGRKGSFEIDVSRFEYISSKKEKDLDGYTIYVYSEEMIIFEKLRAICQQMPEYGPIVHRGRPGSARARDFVDIYMLINQLKLDISKKDNKHILLEIFKAKRVPIEFLSNIQNCKEFHRLDFQMIIDTVNAGVELKDFDFYFDYVIALVKKLKSSWHM